VFSDSEGFWFKRTGLRLGEHWVEVSEGWVVGKFVLGAGSAWYIWNTKVGWQETGELCEGGSGFGIECVSVLLGVVYAGSEKNIWDLVCGKDQVSVTEEFDGLVTSFFEFVVGKSVSSNRTWWEI
jgi:hypothetical protein